MVTCCTNYFRKNAKYFPKQFSFLGGALTRHFLEGEGEDRSASLADFPERTLSRVEGCKPGLEGEILLRKKCGMNPSNATINLRYSIETAEGRILDKKSYVEQLCEKVHQSKWYLLDSKIPML